MGGCRGDGVLECGAGEECLLKAAIGDESEVERWGKVVKKVGSLFGSTLSRISQ